jgi:RNA polymerase sigma-70 factor (ECF subfamily)
MSSIDAAEKFRVSDGERGMAHAYAKHRRWLLSFLNRRFGSLVGEDLVQEAFARTLASGAQVRNPRAFLAKVAIRAALEEARRRPEPGFVYEAEVAVEPDAEQALLLEQTILALPGPIREVFLLSRFGGLSNVEIAERCNLSVKRVEARLTEARRRCAALIRD